MEDFVPVILALLVPFLISFVGKVHKFRAKRSYKKWVRAERIANHELLLFRRWAGLESKPTASAVLRPVKRYSVVHRSGSALRSA